MPVPKRGTPLVLFHDEQIPLLDGEPPSNCTPPTSKLLVIKTHMPAARRCYVRRLAVVMRLEPYLAHAWLSGCTVCPRCPPGTASRPVLANCLGLAAEAANCSSEVAVNCFRVTPLAKTYAAATKPTSLSLPSFVPSSTSASSAASNSSVESSTGTAPRELFAVDDAEQRCRGRTSAQAGHGGRTRDERNGDGRCRDDDGGRPARCGAAAVALCLRAACQRSRRRTPRTRDLSRITILYAVSALPRTASILSPLRPPLHRGHRLDFAPLQLEFPPVPPVMFICISVSRYRYLLRRIPHAPIHGLSFGRR
ncbi:hypothetical protein FB451DRAFT_1570139 [Mycena latifolia]|nr:hypothetical protein FB451DRAFT_1572941 [Mycena latifolia]KAJ7438725.1 hypothetical protein FB451DRAFT_1570139 [Mycena latifolia]